MPSSAALSSERLSAFRSAAATARPSTCCAIIESTICICRSYSVSAGGPFQIMSTPNFCPAAAAPECTVSQKMCEVALGITAIRLFLLELQAPVSSTIAASAAASLLRTPTPVDQDIGAGDEGCVFGAQEQRQLPDIFRIAPAAHRRMRHELLALLRVVDNCLGHFGCKRTRTDRDHGDAFARQLERERSREAKQSGFA